ncbi:MAG: DUF6314 family protein [Burkholderiales bacterium]|nr:DUF6314 family protein [Burkholderiales bacterium]
MKNDSYITSLSLLSALTTKSTFKFSVQSNKNSKMNWNQHVDGITEVIQTDNSIIFHDILLFKTKIHDYKKWIFEDNKLHFWHQRLEQFIYVFSFDLNCKSSMIYSTNHLCKADTYVGKIQIVDNSFQLDMYITSPIKNEHIRYIYS